MQPIALGGDDGSCGQACVFYGAAQFSTDVDLALPAAEDNFMRFLETSGGFRVWQRRDAHQ